MRTYISRARPHARQGAGRAHHLVGRGLLVSIAGGIACRDGPTAPAAERAVAGLYLLAATDGAGRPSDGVSTLTLTERGVDVGALYGWRVFAASGHILDEDFGTWVAGGRVQFRSAKGRGTYASRVSRTSDGSGLLLDVMGAGSRRYTFRRVRAADAPLGYLRLRVVDAATSAEVPVASAEFVSGEGLRQRAGGGTAGQPNIVSGGPGEWTVTITPASEYALARGEANPRQVTVVAGAERMAEIRFTVVRASG